MRVLEPCSSWPRRLAMIFIATALVSGDQSDRMVFAQTTSRFEIDQAADLSREYLASDDRERRRSIATRLARFGGDVDAVIARIRETEPLPIGDWPPGLHEEYRFKSPAMREKYPSDLLYFHVPKSYDRTRPTGLLIYMHGGGIGTSRDAPIYVFGSSRYREFFDQTGMITVAPSAPGKWESYYRWCLRASEQYLVDVIADAKSRFNIDPDRVILFGHSMGGFGAFHHAQRQPDRFAAIVSSSGSWDCGYWPVLRGTPIFFANGVNDAVKGERWHHTDVAYGRLTRDVFKRERLDFTYFEHNGGHSLSNNREAIGQFIANRGTPRRRDAYAPRIAIATPQGFTHTYLNRVRHNRWLTLDETTSGEIEVDQLVSHGTREDFDGWHLEHRTGTRRGASAEAINRGDNRIEITTRNVARLTVWLHPNMIDVTRPITISINESETVIDSLKPSLTTALESYERRQDWGLIYSMKVQLPVRE